MSGTEKANNLRVALAVTQQERLCDEFQHRFELRALLLQSRLQDVSTRVAAEAHDSIAGRAKSKFVGLLPQHKRSDQNTDKLPMAWHRLSDSHQPCMGIYLTLAQVFGIKLV